MRQRSIVSFVIDPVDDLPENPVYGQPVMHQGLLKWWDGSSWKVAGGFGSFRGAFDAEESTQFPDDGQEGDWWFVSVGGNVGGLLSGGEYASNRPLSAGDIVIALGNEYGYSSPTDLSDWVLIYMDRDQATEEIIGMMMIATIEEVREGENHMKAVTPFGLAHMKPNEMEMLDPNQNNRFITPKSLRWLTATTERAGIVRLATLEEAVEGEVDDAAITPATMGAFIGEMPQRQDITQTPLLQIKLVSPDMNVWIVRVDNSGNIHTQEDA